MGTHNIYFRGEIRKIKKVDIFLISSQKHALGTH